MIMLIHWQWDDADMCICLGVDVVSAELRTLEFDAGQIKDF